MNHIVFIDDMREIRLFEKEFNYFNKLWPIKDQSY